MLLLNINKSGAQQGAAARSVTCIIFSLSRFVKIHSVNSAHILRSFEANFGIPHLAQQRTAFFGYDFD